MLAVNPWLTLGVCLAAGAVLSGAYLKGRSDGSAVIIAKQAREDQIRFETLQLAQQAAAEEIAKIEVRNVTVRQTLETQVREKSVYRDCRAEQRVLDTVNEAITGNPAAGSGELPAARADDGAGIRGLRF